MTGLLRRLGGLGDGGGQQRGTADLGSMLDLDVDGNPLDNILGWRASCFAERD